MFFKKILVVAAMTMAFTQVSKAQTVSISDTFFDYEIQVSITSPSVVVGEFNRPVQSWGDLGISSKAFKSVDELNFFLATRPDYSLRYMIEYVSLPETKKYTIDKVDTYSAALDKINQIKSRAGYDFRMKLTIVPVNGFILQSFGW